MATVKFGLYTQWLPGTNIRGYCDISTMSEDQEPVVRVRDRRKFNPDGSLRTPDADEPGESTPSPAPEPVAAVPEPAPESPRTPEPVATPEPAPPSAPPAREAAEGSASRPGRPQDASIFSDLVVQLATQAAMYLGLVTDPLGPQFPTDLRAARQMIDIISMLKEKTAGNLTPDEGVLLERVLTDLRMQFVSMSSPPRP